MILFQETRNYKNLCKFDRERNPTKCPAPRQQRELRPAWRASFKAKQCMPFKLLRDFESTFKKNAKWIDFENNYGKLSFRLEESANTGSLYTRKKNTTQTRSPQPFRFILWWLQKNVQINKMRLKLLTVVTWTRIFVYIQVCMIHTVVPQRSTTFIYSLCCQSIFLGVLCITWQCDVILIQQHRCHIL